MYYKDIHMRGYVKPAKITVLGSGIMGHGIAQVSALAGHTVTLRDIKQEFLDKASEKIRWSLDKMASKGKISKDEADAAFARIRTETDLGSSLEGTDLVIEAVPEIMDLKRKVYSELDEKTQGRDIIFASNTSTLPITEIASELAKPKRFIGIHFFNPPQLMRLVEVIPGEQTDKDVLDFTMEYVRSVGKEPVLCARDVPGFIVNRLFIPMVHEACYALESGSHKMEAIDSAVRFRLGFPMGIFELADFTGMDVIHKATVEMHSRDNKVIRPHPKIEQLYTEKKLGKKSGQGFYPYSESKYERVELGEELAATCDPIRLAAVLANNTAWLLDNDVADIETIEYAAKLGLGMKKPILEIVKEAGAEVLVAKLEELAKSESEFYAPHPALSRLS